MTGMSTESRGGWLFSLRVKLLAVLIPLMGIFLLVAMVGLNRFLHEFFHRRAEVETARLGQAVTSALRAVNVDGVATIAQQQPGGFGKDAGPPADMDH